MSALLPENRRIAIDSSPLEGAGRVEYTSNLIAHAARKIVDCVAKLIEADPNVVYFEL